MEVQSTQPVVLYVWCGIPTVYGERKGRSMPGSTHPDRHNPSLAEQGARKKERKKEREESEPQGELLFSVSRSGLDPPLLRPSLQIP